MTEIKLDEKALQAACDAYNVNIVDPSPFYCMQKAITAYLQNLQENEIKENVMSETKPLKLEVGKYYKLRSGDKAEIRDIVSIERKDFVSGYSVSGLILFKNGTREHKWTREGKNCIHGMPHSYDIIQEWEEPEIGIDLAKPNGDKTCEVIREGNKIVSVTHSEPQPDIKPVGSLWDFGINKDYYYEVIAYCKESNTYWCKSRRKSNNEFFMTLEMEINHAQPLDGAIPYTPNAEKPEKFMPRIAKINNNDTLQRITKIIKLIENDYLGDALEVLNDWYKKEAEKVGL